MIFQVPAWIKNELRFSEQESKDDGNEADDTSDQSDDTLHRRVVDSSMSNIQINKNLAPSKFIFITVNIIRFNQCFKKHISFSLYVYKKAVKTIFLCIQNKYSMLVPYLE